MLAKELKLHRSVVSRSLLDLEKRRLVMCLNPQSKKERYYKLTRKRADIRKKIERMQKVDKSMYRIIEKIA